MNSWPAWHSVMSVIQSNFASQVGMVLHLHRVHFVVIIIIIIILPTVQRIRGTGIRGLMRGMATLPQGNQEQLVVSDKVGRPQVSLG